MNKKYFYSQLDGIIQIEGVTFALSDFSHVYKKGKECILSLKSDKNNITLSISYQEFIDILFGYLKAEK